MLLGQGRSRDAPLGNQYLDGDEDDPEQEKPRRGPSNPAKTLGLTAFEQHVDAPSPWKTPSTATLEAGIFLRSHLAR
jgi:hypothetical protein